jgi:single-strand DNA-binding protein
MINVVTLIGRITKDLELRYTGDGKAVANFTIALDRKYNRDQTDFVPCVVWRELAENCARYTGKGSLIALEGRLQVSTYDNQDGNKVWKMEVVAENVKFLDFRNKDDQNVSNNSSSYSDPFQQVGKPIDLSDDDLPF